jgi:hypothetical protein
MALVVMDHDLASLRDLFTLDDILSLNWLLNRP